MIYNGETIKDEIVEGVIELFEYLKENNKEIVILTSWFGGTQIPRLKRTGLYKYIDKIVAGEDAMKPNIESFELAIGNTNKEDCLMIGDSIKSDKEGAENAGIDCYIVNKDNSIKDLLNLIKKENSIKIIKKKLKDSIYFPITVDVGACLKLVLWSLLFEFAQLDTKHTSRIGMIFCIF